MEEFAYNQIYICVITFEQAALCKFENAHKQRPIKIIFFE